MRILKLLVVLLWLPTVVFSQNVGNFHFKSVDGKRVALKTMLDKGPVVLTFWATWCKPCHKELAALKTIQKKYEKQGLNILAISQDSPRSLSKVKSFVKRNKLPYTILLDPNGEQSSKLFVKNIPYLLLANSTGKVVYSHQGYRKGDEKELDHKIAELFKKQREKTGE